MTPASPVLPISSVWNDLMNNWAIVGIGNPDRQDDGAGWRVIDGIRGQVPPEVYLTKQKGNIEALLDLFSRYSSIILVDACLSEDKAGTWRRIDALHEAIPMEKVRASTHGFGISQAIHLARTLHQLPSKLFLYALSGKEFQMGNSLSSSVEEAIPHIIKDILSCMKNLSPTT